MNIFEQINKLQIISNDELKTIFDINDDKLYQINLMIKKRFYLFKLFDLCD
jgi:hypothetical protein